MIEQWPGKRSQAEQSNHNKNDDQGIFFLRQSANTTQALVVHNYGLLEVNCPAWRHVVDAG